jgi:hypothetical protein
MAIVAVGCCRSVGEVSVGVSVGRDVKVGGGVSVGTSGVWVDSCGPPDWESDSVGGAGVSVGGSSVVGSSSGVSVGMSVSVGAGVAVGGTGVLVGKDVFVGVPVAGGAQISEKVITGGGFPGPQDQPSTAPLSTG